MGILPNAYYNYLKNSKVEYHQRKEEILAEIKSVYHGAISQCLCKPSN